MPSTPSVKSDTDIDFFYLGSLNEDNDFEMDDIMYGGEEKENNANGVSKKSNNTDEGGPSNEDLLYDPDLDDEDEKWVENERQRYRPKKSMLVAMYS